MFHSGEYEILLPQKLNSQEEQPLFLTIGPSVTMAFPILLMALLSTKIYQNGSNGFIYMTLITGGVGCVCAVFWGLANHFYRKSSSERKKREQLEEFDRYVSYTQKNLTDMQNDNRHFLLERYPSMEELIDDFDKDAVFKHFWTDEDYMNIRLSIGDIPFQVTLKIGNDEKEFFPSSFKERALELIEQFRILSKSPVCIDIRSIHHLGISLDKEELYSYECILSMLLQLCHNISFNELKVCIFYERENPLQEKMCESIKFLPHLFSKDKNTRFLSGNADSLDRILPEIRKIITEDSQYLLVVLLSDRFIKEENIYRTLTKEEKGRLFVWFLEEERKQPAIVSGHVGKGHSENLEHVSFKKADEFSRKMAGLCSLEAEGDNNIPSKVDFLSLYKVTRIEELNIPERWKKNRPRDRLRVPIGIGNMKRTEYLDVHEKFHGPHGLVAGTTGSGKSELLQTYLMSLCINFSPEYVNFFLIDYKGGGTGNYIDRLPHCAGSISNLSGRQTQRAMEAIGAENIQRQALLSKAGVNHIDAYQEAYVRGEVKIPMPHLILIIDEFAELKREEPEFMQKIISLAAVGRSLGIHLILATQKPAGVVDDKIWSNSNFKLCLKVQDRQDSMDMLHRAEASNLTNPGQCYIQVGNNEYFECFQTGYLGGRYQKDYKKEQRISLLDMAKRSYSLPQKTSEKQGEKLLKCLVDYVREKSEKEGLIKARCLWVPELMEGRVLNKGLDDQSFLIGEYDDPSKKKQGLIYYTPQLQGHLCIVGGALSGKSHLLKLLIKQMGTMDEFILIDVSQKEIFDYSKEGSCIGFAKEINELGILFYHLNRKIKVIKEKASLKKDNKRLYIVIDNFLKVYRSLNEAEQELLLSIAQEGPGYGVFIIASGSLSTDFTQKLFSKFKTSLCLEMNDKMLYAEVLRCYRIGILPKEGVAGRCLYKVNDKILECQVALDVEVCRENSSIEDKEGKKEEHFPRIPQNADLETFLQDLEASSFERDFLPIGYSLLSGHIRGVMMELGASFIISGNENTGRHELMEIIKMTLSSLNNSAGRKMAFLKEEKDYREFLDETDKFSNMILFADSLSKLIHSMYALPKDKEERILKVIESEIFLLAVFNPYKELDLINHPLYLALTKNNQGIHLGGNMASIRGLDFNDLSYSQLSRSLEKGVGYMRIKGKSRSVLIKTPCIGKEKEDDYD